MWYSDNRQNIILYTFYVVLLKKTSCNLVLKKINKKTKFT